MKERVQNLLCRLFGCENTGGGDLTAEEEAEVFAALKDLNEQLREKVEVKLKKGE